MSWLGHDVEPDSEEGRALMMLALDEAENGRANPAPSMPAATIVPASCSAPLGYSFNDGPPRLCCSLPWGALLLREAIPADASHSALRDSTEGWEAFNARGDLTVWVEWGGVIPASVQGQLRLSMRHRGAELACASGDAGTALSLTVTVCGLAPGEVLVACLTWAGGSRHLHCLTPLRGPLPLSGLLAPPPPYPESMRGFGPDADAGVKQAEPVSAAGSAAPSLQCLRPTEAAERAPNHTGAAAHAQPGAPRTPTPPHTSVAVPAAALVAVPVAAVSILPHPALRRSPIPPPPLRCIPDRALGVELELWTPSPPPTNDGEWVSKMEQLRPLFAEAARREMDAAAGVAGVAKAAGKDGMAPVGGAEGTEAAAAIVAGETIGSPGDGSPLPQLHALAASQLASRCGMWKQEPDDHIGFTSPHLARLVVQQATPSTDDLLVCPPGAYSKPPVYSWPPVGPAEAACLALLTGGNGAMKSEFKSPPPRHENLGDTAASIRCPPSIPGDAGASTGERASISGGPAPIPDRPASIAGGPSARAVLTPAGAAGPDPPGIDSWPWGALNLARGGASEIASVVGAIRATGAGAPPYSEATGHSASSFHVHVNARHRTAGGAALSDREVLAVWGAWVRFDLVTARFARPWLWREPWSAPLYATGSEFAWHEKAWEQGRTPPAASARAGYADVPAFVRATRAVLSGPAYRAAPDDETRSALLFGPAKGTPTACIGRCCSLNLCRLTTLGTLEFRRFHASLDADLLTRWAHFCCCFVECFRRTAEGLLPMFDAGVGGNAGDEATGLAWLVRAQEEATPAQLMREMDGWVDASTADYFMQDSGALP